MRPWLDVCVAVSGMGEEDGWKRTGEEKMKKKKGDERRRDEVL